jgi:hypothetical protein
LAEKINPNLAKKEKSNYINNNNNNNFKSNKNLDEVREIIKFKNEETGEDLLKTKISYLEKEMENLADDLNNKGKFYF